MAAVHVVPLADLHHHDIPGGYDGHDSDPGPWLAIEADDGDDTTCACGPTPEHVPNPHGPDGWLYMHHSLDGREHHEKLGG